MDPRIASWGRALVRPVRSTRLSKRFRPALEKDPDHPEALAALSALCMLRTDRFYAAAAARRAAGAATGIGGAGPDDPRSGSGPRSTTPPGPRGPCGGRCSSIPKGEAVAAIPVASTPEAPGRIAAQVRSACRSADDCGDAPGGRSGPRSLVAAQPLFHSAGGLGPRRRAAERTPLPRRASRSIPSRLPMWARLAAQNAIASNLTPSWPAGTPRPSPVPASWRAYPYPRGRLPTRAIRRSPTSCGATATRWSRRPARIRRSGERSSITRSARAITSRPSSAGTTRADRSWSGCRYYRSPRGTGWDVATGLPRRPADQEGYLGKKMFAEDGVRRCVSCHTTNVHSILHEAGPESADHSIGCERCHGPGGHHVAAVAAGFSDLAIVSPGRAAGGDQPDLRRVPRHRTAPRARPPPDRPPLAPLPVA